MQNPGFATRKPIPTHFQRRRTGPLRDILCNDLIIWPTGNKSRPGGDFEVFMRFALPVIFILIATMVSAQPRASELSSPSGPAGSGPASLPRARVAVVTDDYHGHKIDDPYRWLEDGKSAETQKFTDEQNAHTRQLLDAVAGRDKLRARLGRLLETGSVSVPYDAGPYYLYTRREGPQNQAVIYVREGLKGKERTLVDVNALAADGTIALDWWAFGRNGKYLAYGTSPNGSEDSTLHVIETATGRPLPERIEHARSAAVAWLPDSSGFYYSRYPRPGDVPAGQERYLRRVFFHAMGGPANADGLKDPLIFGEGLGVDDWANAGLSDDGRRLVITIYSGWSKSEVLMKDRNDANGGFIRLTDGRNFLYSVQIAADQIYITTNEDAPRYRVFKASCAKPERKDWKEIIASSTDTIDQVTQVIGNRLFVPWLKNASSALSIFTLEGKKIADVPMPTYGSLTGLGGYSASKEAFFGFVSYATPVTIYHLTLDGRATVWQTIQSDVDSGRYEVRQVWFNSKDGTRVPMFVVHKKGLKLDGTTPTLLTGYGGFNISQTPSFDENGMIRLREHGGIFADVQLRGGAEFGEDWHRAGMLDKKQNTFDDFIAAAEYLIANKFTDKDHLAIQGASNGGLLMGAVFTQRPDLFRAVLCQVPLLDMLRYQNFQIAKLWVPEYGSAEDPKQFEWLHAYSPYHHVKEGAVYPAILFMTADTDTRVDPMHARKMTALMQAAAGNGADRPILLRLDTKAGHGAGKPRAKLLEDFVDSWSFVFWQLGVK